MQWCVNAQKDLGSDHMSKKRMPPEVLEVFKKKEAKNEDGSDMDDKTKRKAALEKARSYKQQKAKW